MIETSLIVGFQTVDIGITLSIHVAYDALLKQFRLIVRQMPKQSSAKLRVQFLRCFRRRPKLPSAEKNQRHIGPAAADRALAVDRSKTWRVHLANPAWR